MPNVSGTRTLLFGQLFHPVRSDIVGAYDERLFYLFLGSISHGLITASSCSVSVDDRDGAEYLTLIIRGLPGTHETSFVGPICREEIWTPEQIVEAFSERILSPDNASAHHSAPHLIDQYKRMIMLHASERLEVPDFDPPFV